MGGRHHRAGREKNPERGRERGGADFSPTAQSGQLTCPTPPSAKASSPPALWLSLPGQTWIHSEAGWRAVTHSPLRSLLGLTTKTCQDLCKRAHPDPEPSLAIPCPYRPHPIPWLASASRARRAPLRLTDSPLPREFTALCGTHPACVSVFYFIFMFNLHCLLGLGLK